LIASISSLVLYLHFVFKMAKEKRDLAKDQGNNVKAGLIRTYTDIRTKNNLQEIIDWESMNTAWVESLGPE
jgi:hypothetical protein